MPSDSAGVMTQAGVSVPLSVQSSVASGPDGCVGVVFSVSGGESTSSRTP